MAFYHCSVKAVQRSKGQTATRSASYRAGELIKCERTGLTHDYRRKTGVMHTEIITPNGINAPSRSELWNMAEKSEKRKDSCVAREYEVALPHELTEQQRTALAQDFCKYLAKNYGVAVDLCIHRPTDKEVKKGADPRNHHAHILTTTRVITNDGLGAKADNEKAGRNRKKDLEQVRIAWQDFANHHLKKAGLDIQLDHRSHKERGLEIAPTIKLGVAVTAMERKGIQTDKGNFNRAIQQANHELRQLNDERIYQNSIDYDAVMEKLEQEQEWDNHPYAISPEPPAPAPKPAPEPAPEPPALTALELENIRNGWKKYDVEYAMDEAFSPIFDKSPAVHIAQKIEIDRVIGERLGVDSDYENQRKMIDDAFERIANIATTPAPKPEPEQSRDDDYDFTM
ncbi:MobQ family relaxase [Moraxella pluranimalium]|nr:MobQ family relaxase [Moraxella pluranimalium]